jgi:hypothetical protein
VACAKTKKDYFHNWHDGQIEHVGGALNPKLAKMPDAMAPPNSLGTSLRAKITGSFFFQSIKHCCYQVICENVFHGNPL